MVFRFLLPVVIAFACLAAADPLPRRAMFGAQLEEGGGGGVRLTRVIPNSSARAAGFREGDVILGVDGEALNGVQSFLSALAKKWAGDELSVRYQRTGEERELTIELRAKPEEKGDGYEVIYGSVTNGGFRQRTVITRPPENGPQPAVLLLPGGHTCFPLDDPFGRPSSFVRIAQHLARNGYVTMRIERPGCGDSEGGPLRDVDFDTEMAGNLAGVRALKQSEFVDPEKVLIYGFSMGGIFAPLLAKDEPVRGIATYGTMCRNWFEGVTWQRRKFMLLAGKSPAEVNREIIDHLRFWYQLTVEFKTPGQMPKDVREFWAPELPYVGGRHFRFYHQIAKRNLANAWGNLAGAPRVLALWGSHDWHTTKAECSDWIVQSVNAAHPGHATGIVVPDSDRFSNQVKSAQESFDILYGKQPRPPGKFNPAILKVLLDWCDATVGRSRE